MNSDIKEHLAQLQKNYQALPRYKRILLFLFSWSLASALSNINSTSSAEDILHLARCYANASFFNTAFGILSNFLISPICQAVLPEQQNILKNANALADWGFAQNERETVLTTVRRKGNAYSYASETLKNDEALLITAIQNWRWGEDRGLFIPIKFKDNLDIKLALIKSCPANLYFPHLLSNLRNNKAFVLSALQMKIPILPYISTELQDDEEVVRAAIAMIDNDSIFFLHISHRLREDKQIAIAAVSKCGHALAFATRTFKGDKDVVLAAVKTRGRALGDAANELKNDREVVLAAITTDASAISLASPALQNDTRFLLEACKKNHKILHHMHPSLITRQMIEAGVEQSSKKNGQFTIGYSNIELLKQVIELSKDYLIRELVFEFSIYDSPAPLNFNDWLSSIPIESIKNSHIFKFSANAEIPLPIQQALQQNLENQKRSVSNLSYGLFSSMYRQQEHHKGLDLPNLPHNVVIIIMTFLPYFYTSSGYGSIQLALESNPDKTYAGDIDELIPALRLFLHTYDFAKEKKEIENAARVEVLPDEEVCASDEITSHSPG